MDINLLPKVTKPVRLSRFNGPNQSSRQVFVPVTIILLLVVLVIGCCEVWLLSRTRYLQTQSNTLSQKIISTQTQSSGGQNNTASPQLSTQESAIIPWDTVMQDISAAVTSSGLTVDTINGGTSDVQLTGRSTGIAAVSIFELSLEKYSWVSSVQLSTMSDSVTGDSAIFQGTFQTGQIGHKLVQDSPKYSYIYSLTVTLKPGSGDTQ